MQKDFNQNLTWKAFWLIFGGLLGCEELLDILLVKVNTCIGSDELQ